MFVLAIICFILAAIGATLGFVVGTKRRTVSVESRYSSATEDREVGGSRKWYFLGAGVALVLGIIFTVFSSTFTVDTGSSTVLKDWSGVVQEDAVTTAGFHTKAPWQNDIPWDIKNQVVMYTGDGTTTHEGQQVTGAEIIITDKDGISAPMDIQVLFSIKADEIVGLTKSYTDQNDFEIKVVENDVKSIPRDVASTFTTVEVIEERNRLKVEISEALEAAWADKGVIIENVNIHGIRYPEDVQQRFKDAQNAETDLITAQTQKEIALTQAQSDAAAAIERATGEKQANDLLASSLTPQVLQKLWIDAIAGSGTIIVPQDFTSLGNLSQ